MDIQEILSLYHLREIESASGPMDSEFRVYSGPDVRLRYLRDRGQELLQMAAHENPSEWISVPLLMALREKKQASIEVTSIDLQIRFVLKEFVTLKSLFSPQNYVETLKNILEIRLDRAKRMLPGLL